MIGSATTKQMRDQTEQAVMANLNERWQATADVIKKTQASHYPLTVNWPSLSVDRTVGKWTRAALQRLRKKGDVEFSKGAWRKANKP